MPPDKNAVSPAALAVLTNNGNGAFVLASSSAMSTNASSVVAADVKGDGKMDLIAANNSADMLTIFTNRGNGGFALAATPMG